nr:MAG TPA: hypothetical protein [Caudoviricetes sp.]
MIFSLKYTKIFLLKVILINEIGGNRKWAK